MPARPLRSRRMHARLGKGPDRLPVPGLHAAAAHLPDEWRGGWHLGTARMSGVDAAALRRASFVAVLGILGHCLLLAGCASARFSNAGMVAPDGSTAMRVQGAPFLHQLLLNDALRDLLATAQQGEPARVLVYLDGDGRPWVGQEVRVDPTPTGELVRRMLQQDRGPALYLGRPCHFLRALDPACTPADYTFGRYSVRVLDSLAIALAPQLPAGSEVVLVGHSGGGALAMLLAARWAQVPGLRQHKLVGVVTLAANLDVAGWAQLHGYTPLFGSLDPALQPALPNTVRQLHFAGGRDAAVPEAIVRSGLRRQPTAEVRVIEAFDHRCCWLREWPAVITEVRAW